MQSRPLARPPSLAPAVAKQESPSQLVEADEARYCEIARVAEQEKALEVLAEEARVKGFELGHREGFAKGVDEAREEVHQQLAGHAKRFEQVLEAVHAARTAHVQAVEADLLSLLVECLGRLLTEQLATRDAVRGQLSQVLERYVSEGITSVRLSPEDQAWLQSDPHMVDLLARHAQMVPIRCVPDPSVTIGGCVIETGAGAIDARLETQLEAIKQQLLRVRKKRVAQA